MLIIFASEPASVLPIDVVVLPATKKSSRCEVKDSIDTETSERIMDSSPIANILVNANVY